MIYNIKDLIYRRNEAAVTLRDLYLLIAHYAKWVIVVPVALALVAGGFAYAKESRTGDSYSATCTLTVTDPTGTLSASSLTNLVGAVARDEAVDQFVGVSTKVDSVTQSVTFTAVGATAEEAMELANQAAEGTVAAIKGVLAEESDLFWLAASEANNSLFADSPQLLTSGAASADKVAALQSCVFTIAEAGKAAGGASTGVAKYVIIGLLGGLVAVVCALAFFDSLRKPIKDTVDLRKITELPILASWRDSSFGDRLWANIKFTTGGDVKSVCVVPVSTHDEVEAVTQQLAHAASSKYGQSEVIAASQIDDVDSLEHMAPVLVIRCGALDESIKGACLANIASSTIVLVRCWADNSRSVAASLRELSLAKANVVGLVLL